MRLHVFGLTICGLQVRQSIWCGGSGSSGLLNVSHLRVNKQARSGRVGPQLQNYWRLKRWSQHPRFLAGRMTCSFVIDYMGEIWMNEFKRDPGLRAKMRRCLGDTTSEKVAGDLIVSTSRRLSTEVHNPADLVIPIRLGTVGEDGARLLVELCRMCPCLVSGVR